MSGFIRSDAPPRSYGSSRSIGSTRANDRRRPSVLSRSQDRCGSRSDPSAAPADLDAIIAAIVDELAPNLVARNSIGHTGAAQLLLTAGDNPGRLRSEASFASLCGASPVPASSGRTVRHRLNRRGDRAANSALHIIAIGRLRTDQRTKDYVARRLAEGHSKLDAIRALKRYLAREVFTLITQRRKEINATRIAA
jgi:transposase